MVDTSKSLDDVVDTLSKYLDNTYSILASEDVKRLVNFLRGGDMLITYSGIYVSPANYLLLLLRSLTSINAYIVEPEVMTYYVAPYCEGGIRRVLIINNGGDSSLIRILDQLNLTGYELMLTSFTQLTDVIKAKVRDDMLIILPTQDILQQHLLIGTAVSEFLNRSGVRGHRLWYELTNLKPILKDLITRYASKLLEIKEFTKEPFIIISTPSMLGPAEYIAYHYNLPVPRYLTSLYNVKYLTKYVKRVLLLSTDVEEFSVKEVRALKLSNIADVYELRIKTDPLTAPIYGLILLITLNEFTTLTPKLV